MTWLLLIIGQPGAGKSSSKVGALLECFTCRLDSLLDSKDLHLFWTFRVEEAALVDK